MSGNKSGILLITHGQQGASLLDSVAHMLGQTPTDITAIALVGTERRSEIEHRCRRAASLLQEKTGAVLILTDLFGSTQATIADKICADNANIVCVHGVNLVMLLEAVATRDSGVSLKMLQQQVIVAGKQAICRGG